LVIICLDMEPSFRVLAPGCSRSAGPLFMGGAFFPST
jgi:hypothetical protein